nr:TPA: NADH dehydrogenase subunit 4l [Triannulata magna]
MLMNKILIMLPMISMLSFIMKNKKFLMCLLSLEMITLSLILYVMYTYLYMKIQLYMFMIMILTFSACEASMGLSLMVMMSRNIGSDKLLKLSMSKC